MNDVFMNEVKAGIYPKLKMIVSYRSGSCGMCGGAATVRVSKFTNTGQTIVTHQCNDSDCDHREFTTLSDTRNEE